MNLSISLYITDPFTADFVQQVDAFNLSNIIYRPGDYNISNQIDYLTTIKQKNIDIYALLDCGDDMSKYKGFNFDKYIYNINCISGIEGETFTQLDSVADYYLFSYMNFEIPNINKVLIYDKQVSMQSIFYNLVKGISTFWVITSNDSALNSITNIYQCIEYIKQRFAITVQ